MGLKGGTVRDTKTGERLLDKVGVSRGVDQVDQELASVGVERHGVVGHLERYSSQLQNRNVKQFRGGLVFKAHRLCVSLNSGLESNKERQKDLVPRRARI